MNRLTLWAVMFVAVAARGQTLDGVCSKLIGSRAADCMAAGNGRYLAPPALGACDHLIGDQVTHCVQAIASKDYSPAEARVCNDLIGDKVVDCFNRTGQPHVEPVLEAVPSNAQIRAEIAAAIEQLRARDSAGAEARLRNLLRALR